MNKILKFVGLSLSALFLVTQPANAIINCWTPNDSKELAEKEGHYLVETLSINENRTLLEVYLITDPNNEWDFIPVTVVYKPQAVGNSNNLCWSYEVKQDLIRDLNLSPTVEEFSDD